MVRDASPRLLLGAMSHFIAATAFAGRLIVLGILEWGPWDPSKLELSNEYEVDSAINEAVGDRKVLTVEALERALGESDRRRTEGKPPTIVLWVHEDLIDDLRAR
jgi:hypothetical protein